MDPIAEVADSMAEESERHIDDAKVMPLAAKDKNEKTGEQAFADLLIDVEKIFESNFARIEQHQTDKGAKKRPKIEIEDLGEFCKN